MDKLLGSTGLGVAAIGVGLLRAKGHDTLGVVVLAIGILMLVAAFVIAFNEHRPPGITVGPRCARQAPPSSSSFRTAATSSARRMRR